MSSAGDSGSQNTGFCIPGAVLFGSVQGIPLPASCLQSWGLGAASRVRAKDAPPLAGSTILASTKGGGPGAVLAQDWSLAHMIT